MRWITALNLQQWADTLSARNVFPGMIADLIRASARNISNIRFPNGDKGQVRGFDGILEAVGVQPYVPDGLSIWEFGVNASAASKAESDFNKRTKEMDKVKRMEMTFVFVSPRTWDNPQKKLADWVDDKKKLGEWKDVLYLDGSMVEDWLCSAPAVAAKYAKYELKCFPSAGVRSTDEFWDEYSTRFGPQLVEAVLLAGRVQQAEDLVRKLSEGVSKLPYAADSPDEVVAFAIAAIRSAPADVRRFLEARTLVVDTEEAAHQIAESSGLSFLPRSQARQFAGLLAQKGPTVVSAGADEKKYDHEVLTRPSSTDLGQALEGMGFNSNDAYELARRCGRSLAVLARLRPSATASKPEWIEKGPMLLPALLAGAWNVNNKSDQEIVCCLASEKNYAACEAPLRQLAKLQDPPIDYVTDVWGLRASVDAFVNLGHLIGVEHLERFSAAAQAVFGEVIEPPKADEIYRPAMQRTQHAHSRWLRDGMMNTLLHMAVLHEQAEFVVPGSTPQEYVNSIVRGLPGLSRDHRLLVSLQDQMALLAEAAPIPFLEALERLLEGEAMAIRRIFEEQKGLIGSHAYYYGVLWGLEVIAWDPQLLLRASFCLAKLAKIDPGGAVSNRPINSLREIFLSWSPNTGANAAQRKGILAHILNVVPDVAWDLLVKLLPRSHEHSSPTQAPVFREFHKTEVLTYAVVWDSQNFVVEQAILRAGNEPSRWTTLIDAMSNFPKDGFERMVAGLEAVLANSVGEARFTVWDALQKEVNKHRTYSGTDWAFPEDSLTRIDSLLVRFSPQSAVEKYVWLFDDWMPDVPGKVNCADPSEEIDAARHKAVSDVFMESGKQGLIELAQRSKLPQCVALAIRILEFGFDELGQLFLQVLRATPNIDVVAGFLLEEGATRFWEQWAQFARETFVRERVPHERVAQILTALDHSMPTWKYVYEYGPEVNDSYWCLKQAYFANDNTDELLFGVQRYIDYSRFLVALEAASRRLSKLPTSVLVQLLKGAVQELNSPIRSAGNLTSYNIEHAFIELRKRDDVTPDDIAMLEFKYLPIFQFRRQPLSLHSLLVGRPQMFMDLICAVFKPANRELKPVSEADSRFARAAYGLLKDLQVLPGQNGEEVDAEALLAWCREVRKIAVEVDRIKITDQQIGALLAYAPSSQVDGAWPHEAVRNVIEHFSSEEVELGLTIERFNMRGAYVKKIGEGGEQERVLAKQYQNWAKMMPMSPRTSAMLIDMAERWLQEGIREDESAERDALRF